VVPRYDHEVDISGISFYDPDFGNPYDHKRWFEVSAGIHQQIAERILRELPCQH
jgi:hypothetical protein